MQVRRAADPTDLAEPGQLGGHRDRVRRLALAVEVDDHVEDRLVRRAVEVGGADDLDHVGDGVLGQQHAAQDRLLGGDVLRRRPLELLRRRPAALGQLDDPLGHRRPPDPGRPGAVRLEFYRGPPTSPAASGRVAGRTCGRPWGRGVGGTACRCAQPWTALWTTVWRAGGRPTPPAHTCVHGLWTEKVSTGRLRFCPSPGPLRQGGGVSGRGLRRTALPTPRTARP